jgi:hypothetical protein
MQIDRRITNGLAWAGAFLVVGVPTADLLSAQFLGDKAAPPPAQIAVVTPQAVAPVPAPASQRPAPKPVQVAAVAPAKPVAAQPVKPVQPASGAQDAVAKFEQAGKPLPSYITDGAAEPAQAATVKPVPAAPPVSPAVQPQVAAVAPSVPPVAAPPAAPMTDPMQTASIGPRIPPTPMPLSMRPHPVAVAAATPNVPQPGFAVNEPVFVPPSVQPVPTAEISAEDLEDWETGPLADFLARRQGQQAEAAPAFGEDEEFFFERGQEFQRRDRLVGPELFYQP